MSSKSPRIAIVADWLTNMAGAERVVLAMHEAFPDAPIYTSVYEPSKMPLFKDCDVRTTWLQRFPRPLRNLHKFFPTLRVKAFRDLDLSEFDIILSSSSAEAKQVRKTRDDQVHICYCHTPIRYYWSHYDEYRENPGFGRLNFLVRLAMPLFVPKAKKADHEAAQDVDVFIANSSEVQKRIKKYYGKSSTIIYPPVDFERYAEASQPHANRIGYAALGRQVPYKRIDLAVAACTEMNLPLTVLGNGSEHDRLVEMAGPTITFETDADDHRVARVLGNSKGFIFPAVEDFGIVQVEALAAGTPVIGFGQGGTLDIVKPGESGILFRKQNVVSLMSALEEAEKITFKPSSLQRVAKRFHKTLFISKIQKIVGDHIKS